MGADKERICFEHLQKTKSDRGLMTKIQSAAPAGGEIAHQKISRLANNS
jgi:hypothetical protein